MKIELGALAKRGKTIGEHAFPLLIEPVDNGVEFAQSVAWAQENKQWLRQKLLQHGAILLRNCGVDTPEQFESFIDQAGFPRMPYIGGAAPRSKVTKGRVLTSNESPPSEPIPFHHEMAQVPNPPAYIFFYCDLPAQQGGETSIVHSNRVYQRFVAADPKFAEKVEHTGVRYVRIMPDQDDPTSAIGRSWRSTFLTEDVSQAEEKMREIGTSWRWLDDGNLYTETATVPAIRTDKRSGMKTFFNSMVAAYTDWIDSRNN